MISCVCASDVDISSNVSGSEFGNVDYMDSVEENMCLDSEIDVGTDLNDEFDIGCSDFNQSSDYEEETDS